MTESALGYEIDSGNGENPFRFDRAHPSWMLSWMFFLFIDGAEPGERLLPEKWGRKPPPKKGPAFWGMHAGSRERGDRIDCEEGRPAGMNLRAAFFEFSQSSLSFARLELCTKLVVEDRSHSLRRLAAFLPPLPRYSGGEGWGEGDRILRKINNFLQGSSAPSPPPPLPRNTEGEGRIFLPPKNTPECCP